MRKSDKRKGQREAQGGGQLWLRMGEFVRAALYEVVIGTGLAFVGEALEEERTALCGPRYGHLAQRKAVRAGQVASSLVLGGRRVAVKRPRVRSVDGHEVALPSWLAWSAQDPLHERALEQMVLGVSSRRYARSLEPLPAGIVATGTSKSAVSQRFVYGTERKLAELMSRSLEGLTLTVLMIDGVHFADHVVLAAVGIDERGDKHVLGLREGATENAAAARALLSDLVERGLDPNRCLLVVIDGAKALRKAGGRGVRFPGADSALYRAQKAQCHRSPAPGDAGLGARYDEPGVRDARCGGRSSAAGESRAPACPPPPWCGGLVA